MPVGSGAAAATVSEGIWPLTTASTSRATPSGLPWNRSHSCVRSSGSKRTSMRLPARCGGRFEETILQQEGGIAAHQPVHAMEEETAQIGGRRKLADLFDIALPAQQRRGPQRAVFAAVIDGVEPGPQALVELLEGERTFADRGWPETVRARNGRSVRSCRGLRADREACARSGCRWKRRCAPTAGER